VSDRWCPICRGAKTPTADTCQACAITGRKAEPEEYVSDECLDNGLGCDGYGADGQWCSCRCHTEESPEFYTYEHVIRWHLRQR
jgi:hypothetical protein